MSELLDPRPVFTIVMGCNGVGKSAWKRKNYDLLPERYYDQDSIAGGIGDWNSQEARARTRIIVDAQIDESIRERLNFGMESTYSGLPGPDMVERVIQNGYRVEGIYLGTADSNINIERIEHRVFVGTGHAVDRARVPDRWRHSLSNLRRTAERFDLLRLFDNSEHDEFYLPCLVEQCRLEQGNVAWQTADLAKWCANWLQGLAQRQAELRRREAKLARATSSSRTAKPLPAGHATGETRRQHPKPERGGYDFTR